jgi:predicted HicB family RNase H-like nuclease
MAIAPKPIKLKKVRVDHRGKVMKSVALRLPNELHAQIIEALKNRPGHCSINTYIIEAVVEKLRRDVRAS